MQLLRLEGPHLEPVSEDDARLYLRVEHYLDDDLIRNMISAARIMVEQYTGQTLLEQKWRVTIDNFHKLKNGELQINLPFAPFQQLNGRPKIVRMERIVEISKYRLRQDAGFATLICDVCLNDLDLLQVEFTVGCGSTVEHVPPSYKQAILMLVAEMYENRSGSNNTKVQPVIINGAVKSLLDPHRIIRLV